ncbi:MAG TPA: NAD(P) transhydrogenase subunit alpha [Acidimicrobiales bacterium]|nr:NAD(P) transhydrogenase subunit alpha [Acidimicrobiales bacterium]
MDEDAARAPAATVGVLAEIRPGERRVALVPDGARRLIRAGVGVVVEAGAGWGSWYPDDSYRDAGAAIGPRSEVLERSQLVLVVSRPPAEDLRRLRSGQIIVGLLDPAGEPTLFSDLAAAGVTAVSLERLPRTLSRAQSMDVLTSQAGVAGYKAVLVAATEFGRYFPLLITAAGTSRPARVLVLGAGVAGLSAIGTARRLGAVVSGYDVRPETRGEIESLGARFLELKSVGPAGGAGGYARALTADEQRAQQDELESLLPSFDVIITTAAVPGRRPPVLVSAAAVDRLRAGTVVVDMAAGPLGGNVEGSAAGRSTVTAGGVTLIGAGDLASSVPTAASDAFSQNLSAVLGLLLAGGRPTVDLADEVTAAVVVTHAGRLLQEIAPRADQPAATRPSTDTEEPDEPVTAV